MATPKKARKGRKAGKATDGAKPQGRGNAGSGTLYLGIRNIRADTWARLKAHAAKAGTNAGTLISDAVDAYLKAA